MFDTFTQLFRRFTFEGSYGKSEEPKAQSELIIKPGHQDVFAGELGALRAAGYSLTEGEQIDIGLQDLLKICPRKRPRIDAYNKLVSHLEEECGVSLNIVSRKHKYNNLKEGKNE